MRELIKKIYCNNRLFAFLFQIPKKIFDFYRFRIVDEKKVVFKKFYENQGYQLDLEKPKTLNEKIQWLKLYDRTPLHTQCADKLRVREFIAAEIGEKYLIPLFFFTDKVKQIKSENLPDYPVIVKTNHDSGSYAIIKDKNKANYAEIRTMVQSSLKRNYYYITKEWQYKNIKPMVIVEKLLMQENGEIPFDYKVHCIHGKVEMISVDLHRGTSKHRRNWYDSKWKKLPFDWASKLKGVKTIQSDEEVDKPGCLEEMVLLSEKIACSFKYVRVDWYEVKSTLYFGEITFHHDSGYQPIEPYEWDLKMGGKLKL